MTWDHKGHVIAFNETGAFFYATVNGGRLTAPSVDAMRKKLDKLAFDAFVPFEALDWHGTKIESCRVTGIEKGTGRRYGAGLQFLTSKGVKTRVIRDTPENRKQLQAHIDLRAENEAERERLAQETRDSYDQLPYETPAEKT